MKIGLGIPSAVPGVTGEQILAWVKKVDAGPFTSLSVLDRLVYTNYEALTTLAVAAGATQHVRLMTTILLAPLRNTAILAKQAATLDALSGGRLTLSLSVGGREDDYQAANVPFKRRGKILDEQLDALQSIWSGEPYSVVGKPIGPKPAQPGGPEILIGGYTPVAIQRLARWGNGYISGGGGPQRARQFFQIAEETWKSAGRPGKPRLVGCSYIALGQNGQERGGAAIRDYYSFMGSRVEDMISALPATLDAIRDIVNGFADIGTDEVILWPTTPDLEQIDQLADLAG